MKLLPMDLFLHSITNSANLSADIVPSATSADQPAVPSASTSQRREIALKQVSYFIIILCFTDISSSSNPSPFLFQEQDSPDSLSPSPSKSLKMKARKRVLLKQLGSHRQKSEQSWRFCWLCFTRIQPNWLMTPIQPRLYLKLSEASSLPMSRRSSSRPHTWRVDSFNTKRPLSASPIGLLMPSFQRR